MRMKHHSIGSIGGRVGFVLLLAAAAAPAVSRDEVTVQVLDELEDVERVLTSLESPGESARARAEAPLAEQSNSAAEVGKLRLLDRELDREDALEAQIEDFDVPEDLVPADGP